MRIRFTRRAQADLDAIFRYIAADNPTAATKLVGRIESLIDKLSLFPGLGHPTRPPGRYVLTVAGAPYQVYYRLTRDEVRILRVRHTSRRPLRTLP